MNYDDFRERSAQMWEEIPDALKQGISGVWVEPGVEWDPEFPDVPLMGLCTPEASLFDVELAQVVSRVQIFHGSFELVAQREPDFDWEAEIWETLTHELEHHLDWRQGHDRLGAHDDAQRENMMRRAGEPYSPWFHRFGEPLDDGVWAFDGDGFVEVRLGWWTRARWRGELNVAWRGWTFTLTEDEVRSRGVAYVVCERVDCVGESADEAPELWDQLVLVVSSGWWPVGTDPRIGQSGGSST